MQLASKIGLISRAKSILWFAGGGKVFAWSGVILARVTHSLNPSKVSVNRVENGKTGFI
jgi:hypothetical protein